MDGVNDVRRVAQNDQNEASMRSFAAQVVVYFHELRKAGLSEAAAVEIVIAWQEVVLQTAPGK